MQMPLMEPCAQVPAAACGTVVVVLSTRRPFSCTPFWYSDTCAAAVPRLASDSVHVWLLPACCA